MKTYPEIEALNLEDVNAALRMGYNNTNALTPAARKETLRRLRALENRRLRLEALETLNQFNADIPAPFRWISREEAVSECRRLIHEMPADVAVEFGNYAHDKVVRVHFARPLPGPFGALCSTVLHFAKASADRNRAAYDAKLWKSVKTEGGAQ